MHPQEFFQQWYREAQETEASFADAMALATCDADGRPSVRIVLYRGSDSSGALRFFTNYRSRKARELERQANAAVVFFWRELKRQVRIEGQIERLSPSESDKYFQTRDRGKQLAAWASDQSQVLENRETLIQKVKELDRQHDGRAVPRPDFWGGYRLVPRNFEFWTNIDDRLHERIFFVKTGQGSWEKTLLAP